MNISAARQHSTEEVNTMHAAALLGAWSDYLRDILRLAKTTRHTYTSNMRAFSRWLGPEATVADITTHAIRRFCTEFEKSHRPRTLRTTLHSLRSFCAYLVVEGWFLDNPAKGVKLPKLDVSSRQTPTIEEVIALVAAADKFGDPLRAALSRAVVMTLVHGGLRRSELLSLHLRDVNLAEGSILVRHGKGDKSRVVYPHEECMAAIREYLQLRFPDARHPFLFCQDRSRRLGDMGLRQMLRDVMAIAGTKTAARFCRTASGMPMPRGSCAPARTWRTSRPHSGTPVSARRNCTCIPTWNVCAPFATCRRCSQRAHQPRPLPRRPRNQRLSLCSRPGPGVSTCVIGACHVKELCCLPEQTTKKSRARVRFCPVIYSDVRKRIER